MEPNGSHCGSLAQCTSILSVPSASCLGNLWVASGFAEYDCCRPYTFDSTGPGAQPALDDGGPSPRSRHVPSQELATLAAAEDQDFKPLRLSHAPSSVCRLSGLRCQVTSQGVLCRRARAIPLVGQESSGYT